MKIAQYNLPIAIALSPMAGITDKPFRCVCRRLGATWTVGEMISGDPSLRHTSKTLKRIDFTGEEGPIVIQIAGNDPERLAYAAQYHVDLGADVIDINMGCPAKKVCHAQAGSALMQDEKLVAQILHKVINSIDIPVTLKTRLGWDDEHLNIMNIAKIAENEGISALAIHGRSRTQMYNGVATYELIKKVKLATSLPIWVNGDINHANKAIEVLKYTGADGVMIGRAAQGNPWLFRDIAHFWQHGVMPEPLNQQEKVAIIIEHITALHDFYGAEQGVRIARKHIIWYLQDWANGISFRKKITKIAQADEQISQLVQFFQMN